MTVCGEADTVEQALQMISNAEPDVAVVDLALKDGFGLELIKDLKQTCPKVAVVVLSMHDEMLYAERTFRAGARGYVMKRESSTRIIEAIRVVLNGRRYMSEQVAVAMADKLADGQQANVSPMSLLSDRELAVFDLLGQGKESRHIAESLHISIKTVQAFCARIKGKLKLETERELLREAVRWLESKHVD
jgi:DNA-binding NarL/FixJ family response regulator